MQISKETYMITLSRAPRCVVDSLYSNVGHLNATALCIGAVFFGSNLIKYVQFSFVHVLHPSHNVRHST